jgi:hypothetical protein
MTKKHDKPLHLDMSFDEALRRVAQTDPHELRTKESEKETREICRSPEITDPTNDIIVNVNIFLISEPRG